MTDRTTHPTDGPVHTWFGLSYSNYQVLPRTLMQSMPIEWQERMVALLEEMHGAFAHIEHPECYEVHAAVEPIVLEMCEAQLKQAGITVDWYGGECPPEGLSDNELAEWLDEHERPNAEYYDADGNYLDPHARVAIRCSDPIPHYRHSYIEPRPTEQAAS